MPCSGPRYRFRLVHAGNHRTIAIIFAVSITHAKVRGHMLERDGVLPTSNWTILA